MNKDFSRPGVKYTGNIEDTNSVRIIEFNFMKGIEAFYNDSKNHYTNMANQYLVLEKGVVLNSIKEASQPWNHVVELECDKFPVTLIIFRGQDQPQYSLIDKNSFIDENGIRTEIDQQTFEDCKKQALANIPPAITQNGNQEELKQEEKGDVSKGLNTSNNLSNNQTQEMKDNFNQILTSDIGNNSEHKIIPSSQTTVNTKTLAAVDNVKRPTTGDQRGIK
jgi:hypothetical protein